MTYQLKALAAFLQSLSQFPTPWLLMFSSGHQQHQTYTWCTYLHSSKHLDAKIFFSYEIYSPHMHNQSEVIQYSIIQGKDFLSNTLQGISSCPYVELQETTRKEFMNHLAPALCLYHVSIMLSFFFACSFNALIKSPKIQKHRCLQIPQVAEWQIALQG